MVVIVSRTLSWASAVSVLQELNSWHRPRVTDWVVWWLKLKIEKSWLLKHNRNLCFLSHCWLLLALISKECVESCMGQVGRVLELHLAPCFSLSHFT